MMRQGGEVSLNAGLTASLRIYDIIVVGYVTPRLCVTSALESGCGKPALLLTMVIVKATMDLAVQS